MKNVSKRSTFIKLAVASLLVLAGCGETPSLAAPTAGPRPASGHTEAALERAPSVPWPQARAYFVPKKIEVAAGREANRGSDLTHAAYDAQGNRVFAFEYDGSSSVKGTALPAPAEGGAAVAVAKIGSDGALLWTRTFVAEPAEDAAGVVRLSAFALDAFGNIFFGGSTDSPVRFGPTVVGPGTYVAKVSADGATVWSRSIPSAAGEYVQLIDLATTPEQDLVLLINRSLRPPDPVRTQVAKYRGSDAAELWVNPLSEIASIGSTSGNALATDAHGRIYVAIYGAEAKVYFSSILTCGPDGQLQRTRSFTAFGEPVDVATRDGHLMVASRQALVSFDLSGNHRWTRPVGGRLHALAMGPNKEVLLAAEGETLPWDTQYVAGTRNFFVVGYDRVEGRRIALYPVRALEGDTEDFYSSYVIASSVAINEQTGEVTAAGTFSVPSDFGTGSNVTPLRADHFWLELAPNPSLPPGDTYPKLTPERVDVAKAISDARTHVRYDEDGNRLVAFTYDDDALVGDIWLPRTDGSRGSGLGLAKLRADGTLAWAKGFAGQAMAQGFGAADRVIEIDAFAIDPAGSLLLGGALKGTVDLGTGALQPGTFLAKFDVNGTVQWARNTRPEPGAEFTFGGFAVQSDGNFIAIANDIPPPEPWEFLSKVILIRYRGTDGEPLWGRVHEARVRVHDVAVSEHGHIFVAGSRAGNEAAEPWVMAFHRDGEAWWSRSLGRAGHAVDIDTREGHLVVGAYGYPLPGFSSSSYVVALDLSGNERWTRRVSDGHLSVAVALGPSREVVVASIGWPTPAESTAAPDASHFYVGVYDRVDGQLQAIHASRVLPPGPHAPDRYARPDAVAVHGASGEITVSGRFSGMTDFGTGAPVLPLELDGFWLTLSR